MKTAPRGIFLTSRNIDATAQFYQDIAGLPLEQVGSESYHYWKCDDGHLQIAIHDAAIFSTYTNPPLEESNLTHLYFKIDDRNAFLERLQQSNRNPFLTDDIVITVLDPDGRKVMFGTA